MLTFPPLLLHMCTPPNKQFRNRLFKTFVLGNRVKYSCRFITVRRIQRCRFQLLNDLSYIGNHAFKMIQTTRFHCVVGFFGLLHFPLLLSSYSSSFPPLVGANSPRSSMAEQTAAKKVEHVMELFGDARIDNYYWLRDDNRSNPEVLSYLKEWNAYTDSIMSGKKNFEAELFAEIKGRIKEDDVTAPFRKGPYYYYEKTLLGKEYVQHCRRPVPESQAARPPSVGDVMLNGTGAPPEHVILDENAMAQGHDYFSIDSFKVSSNHKLVVYAEDTKGDEIYTVRVIDAETGAPVGKTLSSVTS